MGPAHKAGSFVSRYIHVAARAAIWQPFFQRRLTMKRMTSAKENEELKQRRADTAKHADRLDGGRDATFPARRQRAAGGRVRSLPEDEEFSLAPERTALP